MIVFCFNKKEKIVNDIFNLIEEIRSDSQYTKGNISPTDTLVTKILLGTLGCTPAYDRFFKKGLKAFSEIEKTKRLHYSDFTKGKYSSRRNKFRANYIEMVSFCQEHKSEFEKISSYISKDGLTYPLMKLLDMYFFKTGEIS